MSGEDLLIVIPTGAGLDDLQTSLTRVLQQNSGISAKKLAALIQEDRPDIPLGLILRHR
jgi:hypothetical protein